MSHYHLPHFGAINLGQPQETYEATIDFNGGEVELEMIFEHENITTKSLDAVRKFMEKLPDWEGRNRKYIDKDFADEDGDTVRAYAEHHLTEIGRAELAHLVDFGDEKTPPEKQLARALKLVRVALFPDGEDQFATFDYSIGRDLTQYLVVINTDKNGRLGYMTMES